MAVGRAATMMIGEVRKQFEERNLLGKRSGPIGKPDYKECVDISTKASLWEMIIPGTLAVCAPLTSGFMLAVFMANAGGAWDNAKKFIEADRLGKDKGKGSSEHEAAVVGDTIGDPFKDTSGPALNILIKLMTMISLVFGKNVFKGEGEFESDKWYIGLIIFIAFMAGAIGLTMLMRKWGFGRIPESSETADVELKEKEFSGEVGYSV